MKLSEFQDTHYDIAFVTAGQHDRLKNQDYEESLSYAEEFYRVHCPSVEYLEVDRKNSSPNGELTNLWGEQVGGLRIARKLDLKVFPDYATEEQQKHKKQALELEQEIRFSYSMWYLRQFDLFPEVGDHIVYKRLDYEIMRVYVRPEDLWQQTNAPLYVSCFASIYRPGDRKADKNLNRI
jgi:hypothetical protein